MPVRFIYQAVFRQYVEKGRDFCEKRDMANGLTAPEVTPTGDLLLAATEGLTDRHLLDRFVRQRDEAAFAALVQRHGPMVLGVCRRVLDHAQDAEDAFQATFVVLVRKAPTLAKPELLGNWLYGVACRIARKAKAEAARRSHHERQAAPMTKADPLLEVAWRELRSLLDEELQRLPPKYRAPLVLCYLEGLTNEEAAQRLGWPTGSISYRLARGREVLRGRLTRRHQALPEALFAGLLAPAAALVQLPARLLETTVRAARDLGSGQALAPGVVSAPACRLAEGALQALAVSRRNRMLQLALAAFLALLATGVVGYAAVAGGVFSSRPAGVAPPGTATELQQQPPEGTPGGCSGERNAP
jgi:RNA polymerase sigma factor (sigma-70 family)